MLRSTLALQSSPFRATAALRSFYGGKDGKVERPEVCDAKIKDIRNIGIAAHIDAGKTTTTERMLYYAGVTKKLGNVDSGTTTTDFMQQEMDRGITIQSAAVSLEWADKTINLIDTPGHVDFTVEVERSLRVVDGVVALFDAAVGVQAQSFTVLSQARKFHTPVIGFMNKMDKPNADFVKAVGTLKPKLGLEPLLLETPLLRDNGEFEGTVDVISQVSHRYTGTCGEKVATRPLSEEPSHIRQAAVERRNSVINTLTARDDVLAEEVINALEASNGDEEAANAALDVAKLRASIRRLTLRQDADARANGALPLVPVLCGASRRDMGVQPLLDAVGHYLPSPLDRALTQTGFDQAGHEAALPPPSNLVTAPVIALAFKVTHSARRGGVIGADGSAGVGLEPLVFFRVYSGRITKNMTLLNRTRGGKTETIDKLYVLHGAHHQEVPYIGAGGIGAAFMKHACTGDTLVAATRGVGGGSGSLFAAAGLQVPANLAPPEVDDDKGTEPKAKKLSGNPVFTLEGITPQPPTLSYAIEAANAAQSKVLDSALKLLEKEDPSLRVSFNELGQCVISGMGELHLEIVLSRLEREYNLQCRLLRAIVEYTECLSEPRRFNGEVIAAGGSTSAGAALIEFDFEIVPDTKATGGDCSATETGRVEVSQAAQNGYLWYESQRERVAPSSQDEEDDGIREQKRLAEIEAHDYTYVEPSRAKKAALAEVIASIDRGAKEAFRRGPLARLQMHGFCVRVTRLQRRGQLPNDPAQLQSAARGFFATFLDKFYGVEKGKFRKDVALLEPMMAVEINLVETTHVSDVMALLAEKGATEICPDEDDARCINGVAPMRNIARFTSDLRKATKGGAYFSSKINSYRIIEQEAVLKRIMSNLGIA